MMMIIIILTASYIGDDVRIVYALAIYDAIFFDGGTNEQGDSRSRMKKMTTEFIEREDIKEESVGERQTAFKVVVVLSVY